MKAAKIMLHAAIPNIYVTVETGILEMCIKMRILPSASAVQYSNVTQENTCTYSHFTYEDSLRPS